MTDFRVLCADLLAWAEKASAHYYQQPDVLVRARAALAGEPDGPAVPEGREPASVVGEPSDEELLRIAAEAIDPYDKIGLGEYEAETECAVEAYGSELIAFARAVLARWGHQPAPPAAGEVGELVEFLRVYGDEVMDEYGDVGEHDMLTRAAELLEQRHPTPVPVAIPGEEYHEDMGAVTWWRFPVDEPPWVGTPNDSDWPGYHTHFTPAPPEPATALPLPAGEVQP